MKVGFCVEQRPATFMTDELSADRSTAGVVDTTLCRSCLGDLDDATQRVLRVLPRVVLIPVVSGRIKTGRFLRSHGRTFSDSSIIFCTAYWDSVPGTETHTDTASFTNNWQLA